MATHATIFEFVSIDPVSNPKPGRSLQIRRRCMLGQNKREGSRREQQEAKRLAKARKESAMLLRSRTPLAPGYSPPGTLVSDLALVHFAVPGIDIEAKGILFKAFAYNFANQALSPLDRCVDFDCLESASFEWAFSDTAFLHSVLCTSYAINDFMSPGWDGNPGRKTLFHMRETLSLLQAKMSDEHAHLNEIVLLVVMNLALLSAMYGDWKAAAAHYKGLHKIVQLRGNLEFLKARPKLHFKLDRIDLAKSLSSGNKPFFLPPTVPWDPMIPPPYLPLPEDLYQPSHDWDWRLANVFQDFQYLSLRINRNALKRARHDPTCFQNILTSLQSRLVHLGDLLESPIEQLVRLTMLAMMTTTFKTPGRALPYGWVIDQLRDLLKIVTGGPFAQDTSLRLWVLITLTFTITGTQREWVKDAWREIEIGLTWEVARTHLLQIMWIELIHDKPGQLVFQDLEEMRIH